MRLWAEGDPEALDQLIELAYQELHQIARSQLRSERRNHTLRTTELLNEAYLRMKPRDQIFGTTWVQFFGIASSAMRRVLVDHARKRNAAKRGAGELHVTLDDARGIPCRRELAIDDLLALNNALDSLEDLDVELSRIVEMKYFSGLQLDEIASLLSISRSTVKRKWREAKLWLASELDAPSRSRAQT